MLEVEKLGEEANDLGLFDFLLFVDPTLDLRRQQKIGAQDQTNLHFQQKSVELCVGSEPYNCFLKLSETWL